MLPHCYTAVIERSNPLSGEYASEPYESGWAREGLVFIRVRERIEPGGELDARVQVSPDGVTWVDEGTTFPPITNAGTFFVKIANFGNWLRIAGRVETDTPVRATIYLVLKA